MRTIKFLIAILFAAGLTGSSRAQGTWTRKADFGGTARYGAAGFSIGSKGYIGTGYDGSDRKDFWEFDPATNAWTQKANFGGVARSFAFGFSIGSKGYIGTGSNRDLTIYYKDFWEYDPATNTWTQKTNFGGAARIMAAGFSIGSKGYLGTGYTNGDIYKDFWEYDPATDTWAQKADVGGPERYVAVGFSIGGKGYLGTGSNSDQSVYYKDFWEYDPATNTWTQKANYLGAVPTAEVGFSIGTKGYVGTGQDHAIGTKEFWEYDPATDAWTQKANFGGAARWHAVGFSIGDKGYIGTGQGPYKDFWEYTPEDTTCNPPTDLKVISTTESSAKLGWTLSGSSSVGLIIDYLPVGKISLKERLVNPTATQVTINNLLPNTTYQWRIRTVCSDKASTWIKGPNFATTASLPAITNSSVYPNPAKNAVTINYTVAKNGQYAFEITDLIGRVLSHKEINASQGLNRTTLDVSQLTKGVYFINIIKPDKTREKIQLNKE